MESTRTRSAVFCFLVNLVATVVLAVSASSLGWAQMATTGTISGTISDPSNAPVPQATVEVISRNTGEHIRTTSNTEGSFVVPGLDVGTYTVTVTRQGFETYTLSGIVVHPATITTSNVTLTVGQVSTHVDVIAGAYVNQVETMTPEISNVVSGTEAVTLPLNGRDIQALATLMPGVVNTTPATGLGNGAPSNDVISINGMGLVGSLYSVDGLWNSTTACMCSTDTKPNPDAIQEVRILQNNYSVQYGLAGANVVLVAKKSGTDSYHGSGFEYFRNDALNARNFFTPTVPALKQNIFGFSLGGPVWIPGHNNSKEHKTFFFLMAQGTLQRYASAILGVDATAAQRQGTFTSSITDPLTGQPFAQNSSGQYQIPAGRINQSALALINALAPLPNNPGGGLNNYINLDPSTNRQLDSELNVNHNFGERLRLKGEFVGQHVSSLAPDDSPAPWNTSQVLNPVRNSEYQAQAVANLSPSMVNTTEVSLTHRVAFYLVHGIYERNQVPGFDEVLPYDGHGSDRLPTISFSQGYSTLGTSSGVPYIHNGNVDIVAADNWSWLHGHHYFVGGGNFYFGHKAQTIHEATNATWSFSGQLTGNAIADYLLADPSSVTQASTEPRPYMFWREYSPYFQDTWKATRRLNLTAGVRFIYEPLGRGVQGYDSAFSPGAFNPADAPIVNASGTITPTANYNPLNGLMFNGLNGVPLNFTTKHQYFWAPTFGFAWDVFGDGKTSLRGGYGITFNRVPTATDCSYTCAGDPPMNTSLTLTFPPFPDATGGGTVKPNGASSVYSIDPNLSATEIQSFSLSLQHIFAGNWYASVAGAGNIVRHQTGVYNINQPLPDPPYNFNPLINTGTYTYSLSPYLGYGGISMINSANNASWNALEFNVRRPITQGLFLVFAYTWSHSLETGNGSHLFTTDSFQNAYNPRADYGNTNFNAPQVLSLSSIWNLPWYRNAGGWKKEVLGGWKYSDITLMQNGFSLTPALSVSKQGLASRPNTIGAPIAGPKTAAEWFNIAAYAQPAAGYFGDAGVGSIRGPGVVNFDMTLYKDFPIRERQRIEFRAELFNIFNITHLNAVATTIGAVNAGTVTSARDPRIAELVLRYEF